MAKMSALPVADALDGTETLPLVQRSVTKRSTLANFVAAVVPLLQNWYQGDKGDPGGNVMSNGVLSALPSVPDGTDLIAVSGTAAPGDRGAGRELVATSTTTPANDPLTYADANGRNFRQAGLARDLGIWVTWFGAKCDGVLDANGNIVSGTDDSAAIQRAVDYALRSGVTDIWFPDGVCIADNIIIRATSSALEQRMIRFQGVRKPMQLFGTVGVIPVTTGGSVIKCRANAQNAIFQQAAGPFNGFSITFLEFVDLRLVTYDSPKIDAIDAQYANTLVVHGCQIDTGVYCVQGTQPTTYTYQGATRAAVGIRTPKRGNGAIIDIIDTAISGYYVGITINEHTRLDRVRLTCNYYDCELLAADHPSLIGRVVCQRSTYGFLGSGPHRVDITQVGFEDPADNQTTTATAWQKRVAHVQDPANFISGRMRYTRVLGGTGYVPGITIVGGANLSVSDVGAKATGPLGVFALSPNIQSVPDNTPTWLSFAKTGIVIDGFATDTTDPTLVRCTVAGVYEVDSSIVIDGNVSGIRQALITLNGKNLNTNIVARDQSPPGFTGSLSLQPRCYLTLVSGNTLSVGYFQTSGAALNVRNALGGGLLNIRRVS